MLGRLYNLICDTYWRLAILHDYGFVLDTDEITYKEQYEMLELLYDDPSRARMDLLHMSEEDIISRILQ